MKPNQSEFVSVSGMRPHTVKSKALLPPSQFIVVNGFRSITLLSMALIEADF